VTSNVIFQRGDDATFKNLLKSSPVRAFGINLYDQCGHLCNKWEASRHDNCSGTVRINSDSKALLSNIEFPKSLSGQTYLVITTYSGFERCVMKSSKKYLVETDLQALVEKTNVSEMILFVAEHIRNELGELGIDLTKFFKEVYSSPCANLVAHFTEYIAGKSVAGSRPSFQGMINFRSSVEVVVARFKAVKDMTNIECQIRRGGHFKLIQSPKTQPLNFLLF